MASAVGRAGHLQEGCQALLEDRCDVGEGLLQQHCLLPLLHPRSPSSTCTRTPTVRCSLYCSTGDSSN